jgi:hypothetical protein
MKLPTVAGPSEEEMESDSKQLLEEIEHNAAELKSLELQSKLQLSENLLTLSSSIEQFNLHS